VAALAAKRATTSIPIVFYVGSTLPGTGWLRASAGQAGISLGRRSSLLTAKRLGLLHELGGIGLSAGGSIWNVAAVRHVIEKAPTVATSATRCAFGAPAFQPGHCSSWANRASGLQYQPSFQEQRGLNLARHGFHDAAVLGSREH